MRNTRTIRRANTGDADAIWAILQPVIAAGEVYALPRDWDRDEALGYWLAPAHAVFVCEENGQILGSYYLRPNQSGGGDHVANCGYVTASHATGRGIAREMCANSLEEARTRGFEAMQFNFVVSTNTRAIALWEGMGFAVIGRVPGAFRHPTMGQVDALVMYRRL